MHTPRNAFAGCSPMHHPRPVEMTPRATGPCGQKRFDLAKMRELAQSDEFSDSESDGDASDLEEREDDSNDVMFVPFRRTSPSRAQFTAQRRAQQQQKQEARANSSPKGDDWTIIDKSPTFEMGAVKGAVDFDFHESWFVPRM
ncbi:TPA: hypothetical protein N0F65_007825 [Lagenidium giganteum]|uniref:Uncharacterized protein n=1 Tax=Lagenidium giganteum TaxID=4803 RepID=A0AAV2Z6B9_9STRA|nr:TPA: hypothetical protein N0F65_007825 [Lagenidium giganteum]